MTGLRSARVLGTLLLSCAAAIGLLAGSSLVSRATAADPHTISASAGVGGSISPSGAVSVGDGADQDFTVTPDTGYHVLDVIVDGGSVGAVSGYTFTSVTGDHTISASFAINQYTITASAGAGGSISPLGAQSVSYGATPAFAITPSTGYHVADVLVDGSSVGAVSNYTFAAVSAGHTISASFAINTFTLTPSAGPNGAISPPSAQVVPYGTDQTFTIKAATGYYIADVLIDGVSVGPVPRYTFAAVAADHSISATFAVGVQTRIAIGLARTVVTYGSPAVLTGVLYDSRDPSHEVGMGDRLVTVQVAPSATGPWLDLKTLTTSSAAGSVGACTLTVTPTGPTYYRLHFVAGPDSGYGDCLSVVVRAAVRPALGTPKAPSSVRARRSFSVNGTLAPRLPTGQKTVQIKIYRLVKRHWVATSQVWAVNADSANATRYRAKVKLTARGKYRFQAYTAASTTWAAGSSSRSAVLAVR